VVSPAGILLVYLVIICHPFIPSSPYYLFLSFSFMPYPLRRSLRLQGLLPNSIPLVDFPGVQSDQRFIWEMNPDAGTSSQNNGAAPSQDSNASMESLLARLRVLEDAASVAQIHLVDPALAGIMAATTYQLRRIGAMTADEYKLAQYKESKLANVKLRDVGTLSVIAFLVDFRNKANEIQLTTGHAALVMPSLIEDSLVNGEIQTLRDKDSSTGQETTYLSLVTFLLKTYVTEEALLVERQKMHTTRMEQGETISSFAARIRRYQSLLAGTVTDSVLKKILVSGLPPNLQLFATTHLASASKPFATLVTELIELQAKIEASSLSKRSTNVPTILRRDKHVSAVTYTGPQERAIETLDYGTVDVCTPNIGYEVNKEEPYLSSVSVLTTEDMRSWICAGCRYFGHAAWVCPFLPDDVRATSAKLRAAQIKANEGKDPVGEFQSPFRSNTLNQRPYKAPAFPPQYSMTENGKERSRSEGPRPSQH
jgi:hypothetical protein